MQICKREVASLFLCSLFILGGFLGFGVWVALVPVCMAILLKSCRTADEIHERNIPGMIDYCIVLLCAAEAVSCFFAVNRPNSIKATSQIIALAFFWFFFRIKLDNRIIVSLR